MINVNDMRPIESAHDWLRKWISEEIKIQGVHYRNRNVVVDDEAHEPVEKIVTEDLFNKSDFAHYGSIVIDHNNPDVTN